MGEEEGDLSHTAVGGGGAGEVGGATQRDEPL